MALLVSGLVFVLTCVIVIVLIGRRTRFAAAGDGGAASTPSDLVDIPGLEEATTWVARLPVVQYLAKQLPRAGLQMAASDFFSLMILAASVGFSVALFAHFGLAVALVCGYLGFGMPRWILGRLVAHRTALLERQLAPALGLLASALRAGTGVMQGMYLVSGRMPEPITGEFQRLGRLVEQGMSTEDALHSMSARIGSYEFDLFVRAAVIQLRSGGRLADLLDRISRTVRARIALQGEIRVAAAQAKLNAYILLLLPVAISLALLLVNREYARLLFDTPMGRGLLQVALTLQVLGALVMRRLVRLRV